MATDIITTIGATSSPTTPDFTSLQSWEDDIPANLVSADERHIGECLDQGTFDGSGSTVLTIGGHTTDATRNIVLRCATGASFKDKAGVRSTALTYNTSNGVSIQTSGYGYPIYTSGQAYVTLEGLQVKGSGVFSAFTGGNDAGGVIDKCIFESSTTISVVMSPRAIKNSLVVSTGTGNGILGIGSTTIDHCTVVKTGSTSGDGLVAFYATVAAKNTAVFNFTNSTAASGGGAFTGSDYNATSNASFPVGSNNVTSLTTSDQFENVANDFRAKSTGDLQAGTPSAITDDISGETRDATTPWIGCWEVAGGGGGGFQAAWASGSNVVMGLTC